MASSPYSLGKLIDWKPGTGSKGALFLLASTPYSLGKLIDWKPQGVLSGSVMECLSPLPTR